MFIQDQCNDVCQTMGLPALYPDIFNEKPVHDLVKLHCMLFALQYSSANCWMSLGVRPDILIGHSFGHLTALCIAGCISLKDGIRLVSCRARLLQDRLIGDAGCMLALEANRIVVDGLISLVNAEPNLELAIACDNGANSFVVAGNSLSIRKFEELCQQKEPSLKPTRLENSHAYHSHLMDCILPPFNELVGGIEFRSPQIPIETCTTIPISHELDAEHIVHHTRDTVYFGKAVGRISERLGGAIWLEIGSATPITNMIRKTLKSRQPSQSLNDTFIPVDLRRPKVSKSLAGASTKLWTSGLPICHWSFSQKSPKPVILPPYQFEKKKYWLELKPAAAPDKDSGRMSRSPGKLVNLVQRQSTTGELLFDIDTTHPHYHLAVEGHAVGGQGLCPASMYVELVAQCAIYAPGHRTEEQCVPRVRDLHMVSPLGLGAVGVQVKLIKDAPNLNARSWKFIISSQGQERDTRTKEHAMGHFDLRNSTDPTVETEFKLLRQVVRPSRHAQITSSPEALGLTGPMVYKTFSQVVQYASYYQGVANVFGKGDEAAGVVQLCNKTPLELPSGVSAPVLVDNFLQVLGIHANCIADRNHGEVLMCTSIDEMIFSSEFTSGSKNTKDWKVYTRSTTENPQTTVGDIFVFTASTDLLVLALLGVNFRSVQFKSLLRALDRLSMTTRANAHSDKEKPASDSGYQTSVSANSTGASTTAEVSDNDQDPSPSPRVPHQRKSQNIRPDAAAALEKTAEIQMMLMEVLELERQDVKLTFELDALGIDSLMITEVLTEIRKRFNVQISAEEFQELNDVASLCDLINTEIGVGKISRTHVQTHVPIDASISSSLPSVEVKQISLPPTAGDTPVEESYDFAALTQTAFSKVARQFDEFGSDTNLLGFYKNVYPKQSELVVRYVVEAFAQLSCDLASLQSGSSVPLISHISLHEKVIPQLYIILEDAGLISLLVSDDDERTWIRTASPVPETSAATLHQRLLDDSPRHTSETQLLRTTASSLAGCLSGTADALALLFKDAKAKSLLQDVYTNAPMFRTGTLLLARYLSTIIRGLISEDVATDINILELGGGTGGTTAHLLETIASIAGTAGKLKITYTFTDLSSSLVAAAKRRFSSCTFLQFAVLDVEKSPSPEWLSRFDVVLSTNCIHATRNLVTSTSHIRQMLRPHGVLCLIELTRNLFWFDLVFGLLDGWWLFEDGRTHALADEARWEASLRQAGFSWVDWSRGESQESELLRLIVASSTKRQIRTISGSGEVEGFDFDKETLVFKEVDGLQLKADLYYPLKKNTLDNKAYPLG